MKRRGELGGRLKPADKLYIQNEVKLVFNSGIPTPILWVVYGDNPFSLASWRYGEMGHPN